MSGTASEPRNEVDSVFALVEDVIGDVAASNAAMEIIAALPCWNGPVHITPLAGGLSNLNFRASCNDQTFVVRYGADAPDLGIRRVNEAAALRAAAAAGVGPAVLFAHDDIIVMEALPGRPVTPSALAADPALLAAVARALATFHNKAGHFLDGPDFIFWPFHHCRWYVRQILTAADKLDPKYRQVTEALGAEVASLELAVGVCPTVFGHGDLVPGNIFICPNGIRFIDLEYAGFGPDLFDLAGLGMNAELDDDAVAILLNAYYGRPTEPDQIERYRAMVLIASIRETTWCIKKLLTPQKIEFDFRVYADMCIARHERLRMAYERAAEQTS